MDFSSERGGRGGAVVDDVGGGGFWEELSVLECVDEVWGDLSCVNGEVGVEERVCV